MKEEIHKKQTKWPTDPSEKVTYKKMDKENGRKLLKKGKKRREKRGKRREM